MSRSRPPPPTSRSARCTETRACARLYDSGSSGRRRRRCTATNLSPCWTRRTGLQAPCHTMEAIHDDHAPAAGQNIQIRDQPIRSFTVVLSTREGSETARRQPRLRTKTRVRQECVRPNTTLHLPCTAEVIAIVHQQLRQ